MDLNDIFGGQQDLSDVDATQVQTGGSSVFENGVYGFLIERAELKETNAKDGMLVSVMFREQEGNRVLWNNYNVQNKSQKAQTIAREQFKQLCKGAGLDSTPSDTEELQDRPLTMALIKKETIDSGKARRRNPEVVPEYENVIASYQADPSDIGKTEKKAAASKAAVNTNINL